MQTGRRGEILVNEWMETTVPGIYAIGEVVGKAMLAHVASAQGKVAVENIMGHQATVRYDVIPAGIFTLPEIGAWGMTEQQAREEMELPGRIQTRGTDGGTFSVCRVGEGASDRGYHRMFKVIAESLSGKILGVHIVGAHAADLVHEAAIAMQVGATVRQMAEMIHAHPRWPKG